MTIRNGNFFSNTGNRSTFVRIYRKGRQYSLSLECLIPEIYDTLELESRVNNLPVKTTERLINLLRASEFYIEGDYSSSLYYVRRASVSGYPEYSNLKYLLLIGSYGHLNDIENTVKNLYIMNNEDQVDPYTLKTIFKTIGGLFSKEDLSKEMASYFYYHKRMQLLSEIFPEE